ncbi:SapC family protein [Paraburkholderia fynbosensis]|nr:SapC family protein [Paraburkholderia fynbosensis]
MMDISPPFGYRDVKALNRIDYVRFPAQGEVPPFVKDTAIVPLSIGEMVSASAHYPLVFVHDSLHDRVGLVAMLGLATGENLFYTASGWKTDAYQPAYIRRFPFCIAKVSASEQTDPNLLVCVEKDYVIGEARDGYRRLLDDDGKATQEWQKVETFLREYQADLERTSAFCKRLVELKLLDPLTATFTQADKKSWNVSGFLGINEGRLAQLGEETVMEWHRNGWLSRAYLHLFSLQRMQRLLHDKLGLSAAASEGLQRQD